MAALYDGDGNRVFTASRQEGKHTYQLFKKQVKSPYTAPGGEAHSLFWYGFSQNVLQSLSTLPQTVGTIWHDLFDDVSTAYHKKVAKDRANDDGLVVNPPSLGNLPGEGEVTYASQVKDVLIPYTTREDSFHYYEERNYVNDVNREHTEVLQTYDRELNTKETYTYGHGRAAYLANQTGDSYNYLTNQSGSVTGLTKDGKAVSSTSYGLYGATKESTDTTGNPFAYNGEARDGTGLDYLRARYYDSQAGTFLTADSYQGSLTRPLSQNNYSYVENNLVNYTDPSGHVLKGLQRAWNKTKKAFNDARNWVGEKFNQAVNWAGNKINQVVNWTVDKFNQGVHWVGQQIGHVANAMGQIAHNLMSWGVQQLHYIQQTLAYQHVYNELLGIWQKGTSVLDWAKQAGESNNNWRHSKVKEAINIDINWTKSLEETMRHVCETATTADGGVAYASEITFTSSQTTQAYEFKQNLQEQYGFDQETANLMWKLYQNIKDKQGKNADYVFNSMVGGLLYNGDNPDFNNGLMAFFKSIYSWPGTSGNGGSNHSIKIQLIYDYGLSQKEYDKLLKEVTEQHNNPNGKADFAHQSITTATNLYNNHIRLANIITGWSNSKGWNGSHEHTNHLSGWLGDITLGDKPSMNDADYKADLDAVNIISIMKKQNIDYQTASNWYYDRVEQPIYNRALQFKQNMGGIDNIKKIVYNEVGISESTDVAAMNSLKQKNPVAYKFIMHLENNSSDYR